MFCPSVGVPDFFFFLLSCHSPGIPVLFIVSLTHTATIHHLIVTMVGSKIAMLFFLLPSAQKHRLTWPLTQVRMKFRRWPNGADLRDIPIISRHCLNRLLLKDPRAVSVFCHLSCIPASNHTLVSAALPLAISNPKIAVAIAKDSSTSGGRPDMSSTSRRIPILIPVQAISPPHTSTEHQQADNPDMNAGWLTISPIFRASSGLRGKHDRGGDTDEEKRGVRRPSSMCNRTLPCSFQAV